MAKKESEKHVTELETETPNQGQKTEKSFIINCANAIRQMLPVVGHGINSKGIRNLRLYNTTSKKYHTIQLG